MFDKLLQKLERGDVLTLDTVRNQRGDAIPVCSLYLKKGVWLLETLICRSSTWFDLGGCRCLLHEPTHEMQIDHETALTLIHGYIERMGTNIVRRAPARAGLPRVLQGPSAALVES